MQFRCASSLRLEKVNENKKRFKWQCVMGYFMFSQFLMGPYFFVVDM